MTSVGERLRAFRYTPASQPLPWRTVRSINVAELRLSEPDLKLMKNLVSLLAGCALSTQHVREGTDADLAQLLQLFQAALQFTLWSQQVLQGELVERQQQQAVAQVTSRYVERMEDAAAWLREELAAVTRERDALHDGSAALNKALAQAETRVRMLERQLASERDRSSELIEALNKQAATYCAQALSRGGNEQSAAGLTPPPPPPAQQRSSSRHAKKSKPKRHKWRDADTTVAATAAAVLSYSDDDDGESDATSYGEAYARSGLANYVDWKTFAQMLLASGYPHAAAPVIAPAYPAQQQQQQQQQQYPFGGVTAVSPPPVSSAPPAANTSHQQQQPIKGSAPQTAAAPPPQQQQQQPAASLDAAQREKIEKLAVSVDALADDVQEQLEDVMRRTRVTAEEFARKVAALGTELREEQRAGRDDLLAALKNMEEGILARVQQQQQQQHHEGGGSAFGPDEGGANDTVAAGIAAGGKSTNSNTLVAARGRSANTSRAGSPLGSRGVSPRPAAGKGTRKVPVRAGQSAPAPATLALAEAAAARRAQSPVVRRGAKSPAVTIVEDTSAQEGADGEAASPHSPFGDSYSSYVSYVKSRTGNNSKNNLAGDDDDNKSLPGERESSISGSFGKKGGTKFSINVLRTPPEKDLEAGDAESKPPASYWEDSSILARRSTAAPPPFKTPGKDTPGGASAKGGTPFWARSTASSPLVKAPLRGGGAAAAAGAGSGNNNNNNNNSVPQPFEDTPASAAVRAAMSAPTNAFAALDEMPAGVGARMALLSSPGSSHLGGDDKDPAAPGSGLASRPSSRGAAAPVSAPVSSPLSRPPPSRPQEESLILGKEVPCNRCGHPVALSQLARHESSCNGVPPPPAAARKLAGGTPGGGSSTNSLPSSSAGRLPGGGGAKGQKSGGANANANDDSVAPGPQPHKQPTSAGAPGAPSPILHSSFQSNKSVHASSLMLQDAQRELRQLMEEEERVRGGPGSSSSTSRLPTQAQTQAQTQAAPILGGADASDSDYMGEL